MFLYCTIGFERTLWSEVLYGQQQKMDKKVKSQNIYNSINFKLSILKATACLVNRFLFLFFCFNRSLVDAWSYTPLWWSKHIRQPFQKTDLKFFLQNH